MQRNKMSSTRMGRRVLILIGAVCLSAAVGGVARGQALDEVKVGELDCSVPPPEVTKHTLEAAKKFEGKKYGSKDDQLVCTTYATGVLEEAGYRVTKLGNQVININWGWSASDIEEAVKNNDPKAAGVAYWLIASQQGEAVRDYAHIRPGDFLQYWRYVKNRKTGKYSMAGHTAQVAKVLGDGKVRLHGSHLSAGGVGHIDVYIIPTQRKPGEKGMYRTWVARPLKNAAMEK